MNKEELTKFAASCLKKSKVQLQLMRKEKTKWLSHHRNKRFLLELHEKDPALFERVLEETKSYLCEDKLKLGVINMILKKGSKQ